MRKFILRSIVGWFFVAAVFAGCEKLEPQTRFALGTVCTVNAFDDGTKDLYDEIFERIGRIERQFSVNIATSEITEINRAAGERPVAVSAEVFFVVSTALEYARLTDGAFDPTIGPLVDLWGINTDRERVPTQEELDRTVPLVNWREVRVDENERTVYLPRKGMALDLGGIAKGYAADEIVRILAAHRVQRAVIDLGGNVYVYGKKRDGSPWRVGVKNPNQPEGAPALILSLDESTVVTSGVYERFFVSGGMRYHHILHPADGYPAQTGLLSATIVGTSSMTADALSTGVFLLGAEKGAALLERIAAESSLPAAPGMNAPIGGIFITEANEVIASRSLKNSVRVTESYSAPIVFR